jgi:hypothetical protein
MPCFSTTIAPFRLAEGENTPEQCAPKDAEGWMTFSDPTGPAYYYRTKREAITASEMLEVGAIPSFGRPWWNRATIYLPA